MTEQANFGDLPRAWRESQGAAIVDVGSPQRPERTISYAEFNAHCDAFARGLRRSGLGPGARIAILSLNRLECLVALFGAPRALVVPVPINVKLPASTVGFICADAGVRMVFAEQAFAHLVPAGLSCMALETDWERFLDPGPFAPVATRADDVALQIYTSGTTGRPKGVLLGHAGQVWNARVLSNSRRLDASSAILISAPLYHKNALIASKISAAAGGRSILLPRFDARAYIAAIGRHRVTSLSGVPTMYQLMLAERDALAATDVSSVRAVSVGSAAASATLLQSLQATFPSAQVTANYGLTEGGPVPFGVHPFDKPRPPGSVGYPLSGVECRLVGGPSPDEGVLWTRNPGIMSGYHNLPDKTAERLVDGWLDTQDVLRRDSEGFYYFVGRADDMFKCGGESVYPGEVAGVLERHGDVMQAAVIPVADALKGQVPVAFIVVRPGARRDEAAIKAFAIANAPAYMHPRRIVFIDALPLTGTNKVDLKALSDLAPTLAPRTRETA